jgi:trimeric autotransporter adhesin
MVRSSSSRAGWRCPIAWALATLALAAPVSVLGQTPIATAWIPDGHVYALARHENTLYLGGLFTKLTSPVDGSVVYRSALAALDLATGAPTAWNPGCDGGVYALAHDGERLYVGGSYETIGGASRRDLAALDPSSGIPTAWNPGVDGSIQALALAGGTLFAGGDFDTVGGQPRANFASFDLASSTLTGWAPTPNGTVLALAADTGVVYACGFFDQMNGQPRDWIAAMDAATGATLPWNPAPNSIATVLALDGSTLYVGGYFDQIGGALRNRMAAVDGASGVATPWNPNVNAPPRAIAVGDDAVWIGGSFSRIGGVPHELAAAIDPGTGAVLWSPDHFFYGYVWSIAAGGGAVYFGGDYHLTDGSRSDLAGYAWSTTDVGEESPARSAALAASAMPNPLRGPGRLRYSLPAAAEVTLELYDLSGRRVATPLVRAARSAGTHEVALDTRTWAPGCYLYRLTAGTARAFGRVVVLE